MAPLGIVSTAMLLIAGCGGSPQAARHTPTTTRPRSTSTTSASTAVSQSGVVTTESTSAAPVLSLPTLTIASWTGREPVTLYFSGDAGDIATGITWSVWDQSEEDEQEPPSLSWKPPSLLSFAPARLAEMYRWRGYRTSRRGLLETVQVIGKEGAPDHRLGARYRGSCACHLLTAHERAPMG